jgi:hypothetical protein
MPDGVNRYAYVGNDPVGMVDPSGMVASSVLAASGFSSYPNGTLSDAPLGGFSAGAQRLPAGGASLEQQLANPRLNALEAPMFAPDDLLGSGLLKAGAVAGGLLIGVVKAAGAEAIETAAAKWGPSLFRGAKPGEAPSFAPRANEFRVDPATGFVKETHGVSVFDNPISVRSKGLVPHQVEQSSIPATLRVIQRGSDPRHFEIVPRPGANLTPQQFIEACQSIVCVR